MGINCGSQILLCDVPIRFDTYKGCSHACAYCFVKRKVEISNVESDNSIESLRRFISGKRTGETAWCDWNIPIHWGGMSDPFQPCELKFRNSYEALKVFAETGYPFIVSTKGRIICRPEYLELLDKCNAVVQISMVCEKYDKFEKGAPKFAERLEMLKTLAPHCKRLIVRIQPYFTDVLNDVCANIPAFKKAGVYGVILEGMKFLKPKEGLERLGNDFVYPVETLRRHFVKIKEECHKNGLVFLCGENRLRAMGDSMTCCGCEGLYGFKPNTFNCAHLYNRAPAEPTPAMKAPKSGAVFNAIKQSTAGSRFCRSNTFFDIMTSRDVFNGFAPILIPGVNLTRTKEEKLRFTRWLRSTGITPKEVNELTNSFMSSHYLCVAIDGQLEIPTPEAFVMLCKSPKITSVPEYIKQLVFGSSEEAKKLYKEILERVGGERNV